MLQARAVSSGRVAGAAGGYLSLKDATAGNRLAQPQLASSPNPPAARLVGSVSRRWANLTRFHRMFAPHRKHHTLVQAAKGYRGGVGDDRVFGDEVGMMAGFYLHAGACG